MRQIVDSSNISRVLVYHCLNGINSQKNGNSRGRLRLITARQQRILERNVHNTVQGRRQFLLPTNLGRVRSEACVSLDC